MTPGDPLASFREGYADPTAAARAWKAGGGRVVGYIGDGAPVELIAAAGFLPYRLRGNAGGGCPMVDRYLYAVYDKGQSDRGIGLPFVDTIVEGLLDGRFDFLDFLIVPYSRKEIAQVHGKLRDVATHYPRFRLPETILLDRAMLGTFAASVYNHARIVELREMLSRWAGGAIDDDALVAAIAEGNEGRALIAEVGALRTARRIGGPDALAIMAAAQTMPPAARNAALRALVAAADDLPQLPGTPLFVGGSPVDDDRLYRAIEAAGGLVVGENHDWGQRSHEQPIAIDLPPIDAIARRYHNAAPTLRYPLSAALDDCIRRATGCRAAGAVFSVLAEDSFQAIETPGEREALARNGIASVHLADQPYRLDEDAAAAVSEMVAGLIAELTQ